MLWSAAVCWVVSWAVERSCFYSLINCTARQAIRNCPISCSYRCVSKDVTSRCCCCCCCCCWHSSCSRCCRVSVSWWSVCEWVSRRCLECWPAQLVRTSNCTSDQSTTTRTRHSTTWGDEVTFCGYEDSPDCRLRSACTTHSTDRRQLASTSTRRHANSHTQTLFCIGFTSNTCSCSCSWKAVVSRSDNKCVTQLDCRARIDDFKHLVRVVYQL